MYTRSLSSFGSFACNMVLNSSEFENLSWPQRDDPKNGQDNVLIIVTLLLIGLLLILSSSILFPKDEFQ
jgi:hypothetical protein